MKAVMWDKSVVDVTPDNWNDLAYQERQLRAAAYGRKLTSDESVSIIEAFRAKGLNQAPPDFRAGIDQAADSPQRMLGSEAIGGAFKATGVAIGEGGEWIGTTAGTAAHY